MKIRNLFLILAAVLLSSVSASAQMVVTPSGYMTPEMIEDHDYCVVFNGVVYSFLPFGGIAKVVGYTDGLPANVTVKSKINVDGEEYNVIDIYMGAFASCTSLTSVAIPNSVTTIGNGVFWGCNSLTSVNIPNGVTTIGYGAFYGCENLEIIIPSSVEEIGEDAFYGVKHVINASFCYDGAPWGADEDNIDDFPNAPVFECELEGGFECEVRCDYDDEGVYEIGVWITGYHGEDGDITIPYGVTGIDRFAFENCSTLTSVKIPETVDYIGEGAFDGCNSLTSVAIPNSVTTINAGAFFDCEKLESLTINEGVESIGASAFTGCTSLTSITIPNSVETISEYAFAGCTNLESLTIPTSVTSIGSNAFNGVKSIINLSSLTDDNNWGALANNAIVDEDGFVYEANSEKKKLLAYIGDDNFVTIPADVEIIGEYAFLNSNVVAVTILENAAVTNIEDWAFAGVTNVINESSYTEGQPWGAWKLNGNDGGFVYSDENGLTKYNGEGGDIIIPYGVTAIGFRAFAECETITSVKIPETVKYIDVAAFVICKSLAYVTIPGSVENIGDYAFENCENLESVTINKGVETIGEEAFYGCHSLTSVTIPGSVETIGEGAFANCENLESVTINEGVETIGDGAFAGCYNLESVTIPSSVTSIGEWAFDGVFRVINNSSCTDGNNWGAWMVVNGEIDEDGFVYEPNTNKTVLLAYIGDDCEVTIPENVETIGDRAFFNLVSSLTSVTIPQGVESIGEEAFVGVKYVINNSSCTEGQPWGALSVNGEMDEDGFVYEPNTNKSVLLVYIGNDIEITIPESVETIGDNAFLYCTSLTSVTIPESVESIGEGAFYGCSSLTSVTISQSITTIGFLTFAECTNLESVDIPQSVTSIGDLTFYGCESLTSVTIPESVTEIGVNAFYDCDEIEIIYCSANPESLDGVEYLPGYETNQEITYHVPAEYLEFWKGIDEFGDGVTFVADIKSINGEDITIADIASQTYTGSALIPVIEVKDGDKTLVEGTDYTVSISEDDFIPVVATGNVAVVPANGNGNVAVEPDQTTALPEEGCINAGNYIVTITGRKLYYQSAEKTFTINPAEVTVTAEDKTKTFGNTEPEFTATVTGLVNNESVSLISYTISRAEGENVGEYDITPSGDAVQNNYAVTYVPAKLTINAKVLAAEEITISEIAAQTYTGKAIEPTLTVKYGETTLEIEKDYTVAYSANTNAGTAKATVTLKGNYSGSAETEFTINPAAVTVTADNKEITFGDAEPTLTATVTGLVNNEAESLINYTISRAEGENAGDYKITPNGAEKQGNYAVSFVEGTLKINKAVPAYTLPTIAAQPCNTKLADIQLGSGFAFAANSAELAIGENKRMVVFTPADAANYEVVNDIELTINVSDHVHAAAVYENVKAATCTVAGSQDSVVYCSVCNKELARKTLTIPTIAHTAGEAVAENYKAPTCTEAGSVDSVVYCTVCKKELSRKTVELSVIAHTAGKAVAENYKAPTCTEAGSVDSVVYCTVCKKELSRKTVELTVIAHTAGEAVAENYKAPTCTVAGSVDSVVYCTVCKKELSRKTVELTVIAHTAGKAVAENYKAPTCTVAGSVDSVVYCTVCKKELSRKTVELSVIAHTADSIAIENVVAATYEAAGSYDSVVYCSVCGIEISRATIEIPQLVKPAEPEVVEIVISEVNYTVGDSLKLDGGKIVIATSDSTTAEVVITPDMVSGFNPDSVGVQTVTVTFEVDGVPYTTTFEVVVKQTEVIEIVAKSVRLTAPAKIVYKQGEALDVTGGKITVTFSDNSTKEVDLKADMVSGFDADKVGKQTLTVIYTVDGGALIATFSVTVEADDTAISDDEAATANIFAYGNTIVVENATDDIYIYNAMGALIDHVNAEAGRTEIIVNGAEGICVVKTGNTVKRVMVK